MVNSADAAVLNLSTVTIPAKDWPAFQSWLAKPAKKIPALVELGRISPSWET